MGAGAAASVELCNRGYVSLGRTYVESLCGGRWNEVVSQGIGGCLGLGMDVDLEVDVGDMALDGTGTEKEEIGDLPVALAGGDVLQHLDLTMGQAVGIARRSLIQRTQLQPERVDSCQGRCGLQRLTNGLDLIKKSDGVIGSALEPAVVPLAREGSAPVRRVPGSRRPAQSTHAGAARLGRTAGSRYGGDPRIGGRR